MMLQELRREVRQLGDPERARTSLWFFKTGPGEYGEGDRFIGLTVPQVRNLAKQYRQLSLSETKRLLRSPIHEERLLALLILVGAFAAADEAGQRQIYETYLRNTRYVNNWDLVDCSALQIVGAFLWERSRTPLRALARSDSLWERRIAILATFYFIKHGEFAPSLTIARQLLRDREDLIHKAVGWMLREIGKRDRAVEEKFLRRHYRQMPRTMLRYAIERFPEARRQKYMQGVISNSVR
jgi:3-methyladenine DNA glycosylase AlkD